MSSYGTSGKTQRGFILSTRGWKIVALATTLSLVNVALMYVLVTTPLSAINQFLFSVPILGVLVYGAALFVGEWIAERGVKTSSLPIALVGTLILQFAFGIFGAGVLAFAPEVLRIPILGVTAAITAGMTFLIAVYVYARSKSFESWGTYANGSFLIGVVAIAIGTFVSPALLAGFVFIFLGFLLRLGWEIWRVRERPNIPASLHAIGIYIAVMGVFVHILQIVLRMLARRQ